MYSARMHTVLLLLSFSLAHALPAAAQGGQPARAGLAITVTDPAGIRLGGVGVELSGPTDRRGETDGSGQINFASLLPGTYRLRFEGDAIVAFEREVALGQGKVMPIDVTLARAPPLPEPPPPLPVADEVALSLGDPRILSIVEVLESSFVGRQARQESLLSCSGVLRATLLQLNEPQAERLYDSADAMYYVIGGEGLIRMGTAETRLATNDFASFPRGTLHALERRGSRPLVLIAVLGGTPCEVVR
jgi:hypothetical protein